MERKDFNRIEQIKKDTYICSLHFVDQKGPTEEHPDRVKAGDGGFFERRKRKTPKQRVPLQKKAKKIYIACYSGNFSSRNGDTLLTTDTTDNDVTDNSIISNTEVLFKKHDTNSSSKKEIFDKNSMEKTLEKTTQTYDKYCLGTKIEEMIVKRGTCRTRDFSDANRMDPEKILTSEAKSKYFIGFFQNSLVFYLISREKQNML